MLDVRRYTDLDDSDMMVEMDQEGGHVEGNTGNIGTGERGFHVGEERKDRETIFSCVINLSHGQYGTHDVWLCISPRADE